MTYDEAVAMEIEIGIDLRSAGFWCLAGLAVYKRNYYNHCV